MTITGFIAVTESGYPLYRTFHHQERMAKALAIEELAALEHGRKRDWSWLEAQGYVVRPATIIVEGHAPRSYEKWIGAASYSLGKAA